MKTTDKDFKTPIINVPKLFFNLKDFIYLLLE